MNNPDNAGLADLAPSLDTVYTTNGVVSRNTSGSANVSIGSTFFDNVYQVSGVSNTGVTGTIRCRAVVPNSDISTTTGDDLGSLSFGRLNNITRGSNPINLVCSFF